RSRPLGERGLRRDEAAAAGRPALHGRHRPGARLAAGERDGVPGLPLPAPCALPVRKGKLAARGRRRGRARLRTPSPGPRRSARKDHDMIDRTSHYPELARQIAPPEGQLGVLLPGLGAVATTLVAGVHLINRGLARPFGSLTQMQSLRLGKRTHPKWKLI